MEIYSVEARGSLVKRSYEKSPAIALETDATSVDTLPSAVRGAADSIALGNLDGFRAQKVPRGSDGVLTWFSGDTVLSGSLAAVRDDLRAPGRFAFVPVHTPCLEEIPFLTIQPRWFCSGRQHNYWNFNFRIQSADRVSPLALQALRENGQPWAQLAAAVTAESARSGDGVEALVCLWENSKQLPNIVAALVLRNLAVLMVRHNESARAEQFLEAGIRRFSGYAELYYLRALLAIRQQHFTQALPYLEKARSREGGFLGTGGESTYRIDWMLGLLAERVGDDRAAFGYFLQGLKSDPIFVPAVEALLKLRVPRRLIEAHRWEFCRAARREPRLQLKIFEYLLVQHAFDVAQHFVRTLQLDEAAKERWEERLCTASAPFHGDHRSQGGQPGVALVGTFFEHTSLARINREIARSLLRCQELNLCLEPASPGAIPAQTFGDGNLLQGALARRLTCIDLTIRHQWPPDFQRPSRGKLAVIVPWEYGAVPRVWVTQIERNVDELWVPSRFVRDVFVRNGADEKRVKVIPNRVDVNLFRAEGPALRPAGARGFVFLFVGGAIRRKGVDLLLDAYSAAFDPGEDVTLLLVISGATGAYQHNSLIQTITDVANNPRLPHVQPLLQAVDDATLSSLYRGCDVFVLPYRGEGFGMPLLEAMACGKPVITTAEGPSQDFCSDKTAYLVSAREEEVPDERPPLGELVGHFTWFEPDFAELVRVLRKVYEHREDAIPRGRAAAKHVRQQFAWPRITELYANRVAEILGFARSRR